MYLIGYSRYLSAYNKQKRIFKYLLIIWNLYWVKPKFKSVFFNNFFKNDDSFDIIHEKRYKQFHNLENKNTF